MTDAAAPRSYRPGEWFGLFGDHATVLLPPSQKERVMALWALVDDGAGFDEVLDVLVSGGLSELPGFVLVGTDGGDTRVVIRGDARGRFTTASSTVEVTGAEAVTWAERTIPGVTGMRLVVDEGSGLGAPYPVGSGLVRVSEVVAPTGADPDRLPDTDGTESDLPLADTAPPGPIGPEPDLPPPPPVPPVGAPSGPPPPVVRDRPPEPAPEDHDGLTGIIPPVEAEPAPVVTPPVATLVFSHGERVDVDRAVLVGRAPEPRGTADDRPRLVSVPSPAREISSTHLEVRPGSGPNHGSAVVIDLGSTNGTVLVQPGMVPEELEPGVEIPLLPGAILDLGDGVTIQATNP